MEVENRFVTMVDYIKGQPSESNFEIRSSPLPSLSVTEGSGEILVRNLYLSVDPYLVNRMKEYSSSQPAIYIFSSLVPGQRIDAPGIGEVVASADPGFQKGDFVAGLLEWAEYSSVVVEGSMIRKIDSREFPLSYHAGLLGFSGFTAYFGFYDVCKPKRGEKVYVSAASGSVGYAVGQYAKTMGCYVVGSTGTKQKGSISMTEFSFNFAPSLGINFNLIPA